MGIECLTLSTVPPSLSSRPQGETCRQRRALICKANASKDTKAAIKNNSTKKVLRKNPAIYKKPTGLEEHIVPSGRTLKKPEVLAPAGGWPQLMSACENGADAVYFGVSNGELKDLADQKYLLSPQDLAAADLMPELIRAGIVSLKIEGRLKSPEYVAITCQVYREAVDKAWRAIQDGNTDEELRLVDDDMWHDLQTTFARGQDATHTGLTHGFLKGPKHQTLVRGRNPRHRGVYAGEILGTDAAKQRFTLHEIHN
eukprot:jgi/Picre1/30063/NNA_005434.t1